MKRLVLIISMVLLLALAACDTMGPPAQQALPTDVGSVPTQESVPGEVPTEGSGTGEQPEGTTAQPGADLMGVTWEWVSLLDPMGQTTATDPARYTIAFNADNTAAIRADCNNVVASYFTDGVNLEIEPGVSTLAACPEDTQDQVFINSLTAVESYVVQDTELFMTLAGGTGTIIFRTAAPAGDGQGAPAEPSLIGTTWEWVSLTTPVETVTAGDPTRYTVLFKPDGTADVQADCNTVLATYTATVEGTIAIMLGPTTLMACPEDSQADVFTAGLGNAAIYSFIDGDLLLDMPAGAGTLRFRAAGGDSTSASVDDELTGIVWQWEGTSTPTEEIVAADPSRYTIIFNADGTAGITADCNVGNAEYTIGEDGSMTITLGVSTLAFCENSQDTQFRAGLASAAVYYIDEGKLFIDLVDGTGTMTFRNGGAPETEPPAATDTLTGVTWQWVKTVTPVEEIVAADQTRYTILFNEDGTANIKADCNTGLATYSTGEGGSITITPGAMTLAMCPEDSQATQFMSGLSAAAIYFFQDGNLLIDQFASSGTMHFAPETGASEGTQLPGKGQGATQPGASGELVGPVWQLNLITKISGNITINDPTRYTITFNADGTINYQADCNVGGGTYTTGEGGALTITLGFSSMAFCGPGSLDQVYLGGLTNAMNYRIEEGNLVIDMLYESGSLVFSPAP